MGVTFALAKCWTRPTNCALGRDGEQGCIRHPESLVRWELPVDWGCGLPVALSRCCADLAAEGTNWNFRKVTEGELETGNRLTGENCEKRRGYQNCSRLGSEMCE